MIFPLFSSKIEEKSSKMDDFPIYFLFISYFFLNK